MIMNINILTKALCLISTILVVTKNVSGHGILKTPRGQQSINGPMHREFCNSIAPTMRQNYGHYPGVNMGAFAADFARSQYNGDLRKLFKAKSISNSEYDQRTNPSAQQAPTHVRWQNFNGDNFVIDHNGPCAIYVVHGNDAKRIFHDDDCVKKYRTSNIPTPTLPQECGSGGCMMEFYWLVTGVNSGVPTGEAQYYFGAVKLTGSGNGSTGTQQRVSSSGGSDGKDACGCIKGETGWSQHAGQCTTTSKTEDNDECDGTKGKCIGQHCANDGHGSTGIQTYVSSSGGSNGKDACGCIKGETGWSQHAGKCTTTSRTEDNDECD
eukprot:Pgem_evm1s18127